MKSIKKLLLVAIALIITTNINAQLKVFTAGEVSIGATVSPSTSYGVDNIIVGSKLAFPSTANPITSSALIRGANTYSTASTPDFSWYGDNNTGLYHPYYNSLAISTNGALRQQFGAEGRVNFYNSDNDAYANIFIVNANNAYSKVYVLNYNNSHTFYVTGNGSIFSRGNYIGSDINFKEDINTINSALDKVLQLRGVTFKMKHDVLNDANDTLTVISSEENPTQMGVIAQEIEEIVPEVVLTQPDGKKYVAYSNLVGLLIEAIKEQQEQITNLQEDLNKCCDTDNSGSLKSMSNNNEDFSETKLFQNNPNPFSNTTIVKYIIAEKANNAQLLIFNMQGTLIKTYANLNSGSGEITISSGELKAGMYMYSLIANGKEIDTKRMILTK